MTTAASKQGSRHCSSQHANDAPTAECQAFCADQFRKFHCLWCKCRACTFCPREDDKLALIEELHPPPPPPSPAQPVGLLFPSAVQRAGTGLGQDNATAEVEEGESFEEGDAPSYDDEGDYDEGDGEEEEEEEEEEDTNAEGISASVSDTGASAASRGEYLEHKIDAEEVIPVPRPAASATPAIQVDDVEATRSTGGGPAAIFHSRYSD